MHDVGNLPGYANSDDISHVGVVVHECTHFFGLPDLYDTDSSSAVSTLEY